MKRPPPALMVAISRARLSSLYHLSARYGRSAPYRRLHQLLPLHPPYSGVRSLRDAAPLTSHYLRSTRQFSLNGAWRQEPQPKCADPESPESASEKAQFSRSSENRPSNGESQKEAPAESSQNNPSETSKSESESSGGEKRAAGEGEQKASEENGKNGEGEGEGKADEPPPPPPPHGDKTPWQVFTETLRTEFKASKEWNESTKALQSGYQDLAQNAALQKAKSAYEEASKTASSTTSAALKTTGKAIGQSAAWAWDTPVAKVVRKGAVVAGSGIEKVTRPVRETEAFKQVKDVIDDGSSSRYGGWLEKEERKRIRALREAEAEKEGLRAPPAEVDPK
jgi:mitochondrial import inner membrane translocase subunit TIM44